MAGTAAVTRLRGRAGTAASGSPGRRVASWSLEKRLHACMSWTFWAFCAFWESLWESFWDAGHISEARLSASFNLAPGRYIPKVI
jgi:hypothetical protein